MIGKTISHYRIVDKIGQGGMGEVYLARDTKLERDVALKFIPDSLRADETARERLLREAKAASQLNHPHIVSLYNIEEADGRDFIVMEYVEGRSLREVIAAHELTLTQAADIARQIATALAAANAKGIVHRDIKADNILLTPAGKAKVLDFGLAKIEGAAQLTESTSTLGTVAYMSPEQAQGGSVDHRSDLFSLGVLLYEMITGHRPFRGEHATAITYAIVNQNPDPLARYRADIPEELQRIVEKALRKDRETRYQTAADLAADLESLSIMTSRRGSTAAKHGRKRWIAAAVVIVAVVAIAYFVKKEKEGVGQAGQIPDRIKIAVMPFENLGSAEDEYFADGISEEITARLAAIGDLGVIARTSVLRYKGSSTPIEQIGRELDVEYVLEGTVRWQKGAQSRVRVTPQLIRVADETHMWANIYDEPLDSVFEVQSEIAQNVIAELGITLLQGHTGALRAAPTDNMEAYDLFLQALNLSGTAEGTYGDDLLIPMLKKVIELDPEFAAAHAELSSRYSIRYWFATHSEDDKRLSKQYAEQAIALDPNLVEARVALGFYYYHCELDYERAREEFEAALRLQPSNAPAISAIAFVQRRQGKWDETLANLFRARELDPQDALYPFEIGETLLDLRRYEESLSYFDRSMELDPEGEFSYYWKALAYILWKGDVAKAREVLNSCPVALQPSAQWLNATFYAYDRDYARMLELLDAADWEAAEFHFYYVPRSSGIAMAYLWVGKKDLARQHFEKALEHLEAKIAAEPGDSRLYSALGLVYAGLGQKEKAIITAKKGVEIMPVSKDAKQGPARIDALARAYVMVGEHDAAIDEIERLLEMPAGLLSPHALRLDPTWDPLRDHPRFQKLVRHVAS